MKPVTAWAAYRDGKFHDVFNPRIYRTQRGAKFYAGDDEVKPVRIVPESEYKRMRQAERSLMAMDREWEAKLAKKKAVNRGK
jgi:hypothetical protein